MQRHSTYTLRPSRRLGALLILLGAGASVALWLLPLALPVSLMLSVVIAGWALYRWHLDAKLRSMNSCVALRLEGDEAVVMVLRDGRHVPGRLSATSLITPFLVILNVSPEARRLRRSLVLLPDCMSRQNFRRLRVALRWNGKTSQSTV
jgi:toxin CptA